MKLLEGSEFMDKLISVVVPMYNTEKFIGPCLDSLLNQTYQNFEVIIVDNGSSDNSREIAGEYVSKDKKFQLTCEQTPGPSAARNKGIKMSKGYFLYFLDSDDFIDENTFETLIGVYESEEVDLVTCDGQTVFEADYLGQKNENYSALMSDFYNRSKFLSQVSPMTFFKYLESSFYNDKFRPNTALYLFKRDLLIANEIFFNERITHYEDLVFLYDVGKFVKTIRYISNEFYYRRIRTNSLMTNEDANYKIMLNMLFIMGLLKSEAIDSDQVNIRNMVLKYLFSHVVNLWASSNKKETIKLDPNLETMCSLYEKYFLIRSEIEEEYYNNLKFLESNI